MQIIRNIRSNVIRRFDVSNIIIKIKIDNYANDIASRE